VSVLQSEHIVQKPSFLLLSLWYLFLNNPHLLQILPLKDNFITFN
jgi:hypothetical protein